MTDIDLTDLTDDELKCLGKNNVLTATEYHREQGHRAKLDTSPHEPRKPEQTSADKISALCDELKKFLLVKNERYGDSALNPIKVFSKGTPGDKIDTRMDDKISRIMKSDEQRKNDFVDLTGYLVLKCIDKGWTDFSDLLD